MHYGITEESEHDHAKHIVTKILTGNFSCHPKRRTSSTKFESSLKMTVKTAKNNKHTNFLHMISLHFQVTCCHFPSSAPSQSQYNFLPLPLQWKSSKPPLEYVMSVTGYSPCYKQDKNMWSFRVCICGPCCFGVLKCAQYLHNVYL